MTNFLSKQEKIMAAQLFCEMNNFCRKCGKSGHFIGSCKSNDKAEWVSNFGGELEFNKSPSIRKCFNCSKDITLSPNYYKYCQSNILLFKLNMSISQTISKTYLDEQKKLNLRILHLL